MRLLLDTHVLLWWLSGSAGLSPDAAVAIRSRDNDVFVSVASLWEIAIKQSSGKLKVDMMEIRDRIRGQSFDELPILGHHAEAILALPRHHGDPFDRMLVAQACCEGLTLVTYDREMTAYDVPILFA
jgi:PIN domain nuclease of toxin-antitoxin system